MNKPDFYFSYFWPLKYEYLFPSKIAYLVKDSTIKTNRGILVNDYLETNISDIYAAGDCAEKNIPESDRNPFEQLWYTGRMQGEAIAKTILGERTKYERGIWFNSAKFLDIEYHTYGFVSSIQRDGEETFWWGTRRSQTCNKYCFSI